MAKTEILSSFNRLQLDVFQALENLYNPHPPQVQQNSSRKRSQPLPREDALRLSPIGTPVVKESGSKTLSGEVYDYRVPYWRAQHEGSGCTCRDRRCTGWPGARHDDTQGHTSQPLHVGNIHGLLACLDSKHPSCVRGRVHFRPTECASVRCHSSGHCTMESPTNYNIVCRRSGQVGSYRPRTRPSKLLAVRLGKQLPIGILGRLLDCKAQRKLRRSP